MPDAHGRTPVPRRWRLFAGATAACFVALGVLAAFVRWHGAPPTLANSAVGAPFVGLFNAVRERAYFAVDDDCLDALTDAGVDFTFVADPPERDACPLRNVVRVLPTRLLRRPLYMTCRLALALDRFDRQVLEPAAQRHFGQSVAHLIENGVRNCRAVEGYRSLLSEHAFANAIDIEGFVLRDGTAIVVTDEPGRSGAAADFLREVTAQACDVFRTVLGPGFDDRHRAHVHLDMGLLGGCRP